MGLQKIYGVLTVSIIVVAITLRLILSYFTDPVLKTGVTLSTLLVELGVQFIFWMITMQGTFAFAARIFEDEDWLDYLEEHNLIEGTDPVKTYYYEFFAALHHSVGGSFLSLGWFYGNEILFCHGLFVEMAFEVYDLLRVGIGWLRKQPDCGTPWLVIVLLHHLPGSSLIIPISLCCLSHPNIQVIASSLLTAGGISGWIILGSKVLNIKTAEGQKSMTHLTIINLIFFVFFRFVVATPASISMIREHWGTTFGYTFTGAFSLMTFFNTLVLVLLFAKLMKLLKGKKKEERQKSSLALVRAMPSRYLLQGVVHEFATKTKKRDWFSSPDLLHSSAEQADRRKQLQQTRSWRNSKPKGLFPTLARNGLGKINENEKKEN